jgi:hypothetical protein
MNRYPIRMWHSSSGWIHVTSVWDEAQWSAKGWIPEDVYRASKAVSAPPVSAVADLPIQADAGEGTVQPKRGRPRKDAV